MSAHVESFAAILLYALAHGGSKVAHYVSESLHVSCWQTLTLSDRLGREFWDASMHACLGRHVRSPAWRKAGHEGRCAGRVDEARCRQQASPRLSSRGRLES